VTIDHYRTICPCQRHTAPSLWSRGLRIASRVAAILFSIPLGFAALDLPTSAMNTPLVDLPGLRSKTTAAMAPETNVETTPGLPIFTTPEMREQFLDPKLRTRTLDVFKEEYFRRHVPYGAIIYREARKNDLPPELVAAIVHTESGFRAHLVSERSAQGLMQIVPDTARLLGVADPFNPEENIAAGTRYFRYLLNRFEDESVALAAYNAGEGKVERCRCIPPFQETRDYIDRVNRSTDRYRQRVAKKYLATLR
jgi:hypothetical protein